MLETGPKSNWVLIDTVNKCSHACHFGKNCREPEWDKLVVVYQIIQNLYIFSLSFHAITFASLLFHALTGSSVNPLTPCPVVITTIVALPNSAYPAATKFLPGWRASSMVGGPSCSYSQEKSDTFIHFKRRQCSLNTKFLNVNLKSLVKLNTTKKLQLT